MLTKVCFQLVEINSYLTIRRMNANKQDRIYMSIGCYQYLFITYNLRLPREVTRFSLVY